MTKIKLVATAATLWGGGFIATGALAYALHRDFVPPPSALVARAMPEQVTLTPIATTTVEPESVIVLPTVEIVGSIPRPVVHAAPPPPHVRDISEMKCSDWRPLEQGSNSVRLCE